MQMINVHTKYQQLTQLISSESQTWKPQTKTFMIGYYSCISPMMNTFISRPQYSFPVFPETGNCPDIPTDDTIYLHLLFNLRAGYFCSIWEKKTNIQASIAPVFKSLFTTLILLLPYQCLSSIIFQYIWQGTHTITLLWSANHPHDSHQWCSITTSML